MLLVYDGVAADEAGIIVDVLAGAGITVTIASVTTVAPTAYRGRVVPTRRAQDLADCDALVIPGGMGVRRAAANPELRAAIARLAADATWLAATSTGSVLLGAAGVIGGARATTHWLAGELLEDHGIELVNEGFVEHGRLLTAAGAVSAATLAFRLVGAVAGVAAETEARARFQPRDAVDPRYRTKRRHRWRRPGRSAADGARSTPGGGRSATDGARSGPDESRPEGGTLRSRIGSFLGRRRRITSISDRIDPHGSADVVVLDLPPIDDPPPVDG